MGELAWKDESCPGQSEVLSGSGKSRAKARKTAWRVWGSGESERGRVV